jgi:hypothetical protein
MLRTPWPWEKGETDAKGDKGPTGGSGDALVCLTSSTGNKTYVTQEALDRMEARCKRSHNQPRPDVLTVAEEREFSENIGTPVKTWSEAKEAMRVRDLRFVEKGDNRDKWERERKEWVADGSVGPQPTPNATVMGNIAPPNIRKLLKEAGYGY